MAGIDINTILEAIPEDRKIKGLQKLGQLLIQKGTELENQLPSAISNLTSQFTSGSCPDPVILQSIIEKRNNIVGKLNTTGQSINTATTTYTGVSNFLNVLLPAISNFRNIRTGLNQAIKVAPVAPGSAVAVLNDLGDIIDRLTFDSLGNSKLQQQKDRLDSLIIPIALFSKTLQNIITLLNSLDALILNCDPNSPLDSPSDTITQTVNSQIQAEVNEGSYKGFTFAIEEVPFSSTVNRRKAVALNQSGIPVLETVLSFTSNNQTLINELKLIIDRDNLKAY
jgi:hypothetical protein